jgi:membrane protein YdbS with pleckstrin-like domain
MGAAQQVEHLRILGRVEIAIIGPDTAEVLRGAQRDDGVDARFQPPRSARRHHWRGDNRQRRAADSCDFSGGTDGGAGRDAVVNHDRDAPSQIQRTGRRSQRAYPCLQLCSLTFLNRQDHRVIEGQPTQQLCVENGHTTFANCSHRQLRLQRDAELAHDEHIQRRIQRPSNLKGDRNPATWQTENHHPRPLDATESMHVTQQLTQQPAGLSAVGKTTHTLTSRFLLRRGGAEHGTVNGMVTPEPAAEPSFGLHLREPANLVSRKAIRFWTVRAGLGWVVIATVQVLVYIQTGGNRRTNVIVFILSLMVATVHLIVMPRWRYRVHRWELSATAVYAQSGWFSQERRIAPLSRIQTVDTERGPLEQLFKLANVTVTTASAAGPIKIDGLDAAAAAQLVDELTTATAQSEGDAT